MHRKCFKKLSLFFICMFIAMSSIVHAQPERYIVKFKQEQDISILNLKSKLLARYNGNKEKDFRLNSIANNTYLLTLEQSVKASTDLLSHLSNDPNIKYIVKDHIGYFKPVPDPKPNQELMNQLARTRPVFSYINQGLDHSLQWDEFSGPEGVFLESKPGLSDGAWLYTTGFAGLAFSEYENIIVAVLDTGIEYNSNLDANVVKHPNTNKYWGWNFSANNRDLSDETGGYHGTHVAGTIAAHGPSIMGMGTDLKILPVKIPDATGMFYESNVIKAIYWAIGEDVDGVENNIFPAKVINMSFGIDEYIGKEVDECSPAVQEAIDYARSKGVIIVVAAGNSNMDHDLGSPGGCSGTLRVASTGPTGLRSYFSNYGEGITFAAPGGDKRYGQNGGILSTVKDSTGIDESDFDFYQGTSMASPHVAGLAGLLYSVNNEFVNFSTADIEKLLYSTTHDFPRGLDSEYSCVGKKSCGHGIIDANNAVQAAIAEYDIIFNSPTKTLLGLEQSDCRTGLAKPKNKEIIRAEGTWHLDEDSNICQYEAEYTHPIISMSPRTNSVIASYGHVTYTLDYTSSKYCEKIGYDGVGCYKL